MKDCHQIMFVIYLLLYIMYLCITMWIATLWWSDHSIVFICWQEAPAISDPAHVAWLSLCKSYSSITMLSRDPLHVLKTGNTFMLNFVPSSSRELITCTLLSGVSGGRNTRPSPARNTPKEEVPTSWELQDPRPPDKPHHRPDSDQTVGWHWRWVVQGQWLSYTLFVLNII